MCRGLLRAQRYQWNSKQTYRAFTQMGLNHMRPASLRLPGRLSRPWYAPTCWIRSDRQNARLMLCLAVGGALPSILSMTSAVWSCISNRSLMLLPNFCFSRARRCSLRTVGLSGCLWITGLKTLARPLPNLFSRQGWLPATSNRVSQASMATLSGSNVPYVESRSISANSVR